MDLRVIITQAHDARHRGRQRRQGGRRLCTRCIALLANAVKLDGDANGRPQHEEEAATR